jgi:hypothetical protein
MTSDQLKELERIKRELKLSLHQQLKAMDQIRASMVKINNAIEYCQMLENEERKENGVSA